MKIFIINMGLHMSYFLKVGYIYSYSFAFKSKSFLWLMGDEEVKEILMGRTVQGIAGLETKGIIGTSTYRKWPLTD